MQLILADSEAEVIFVDEFFADHLLRAIAPVRKDLPLRKIVLIGDGEHECDLHYADIARARSPEHPGGTRRA